MRSVAAWGALVALAACGKSGGDAPDAALDAPDATASVPDAAPRDASEASDAPLAFDAGASVLMHHEHPTRDGVYVDPALTKSAVAGLHLDAAFNATFTGTVYAQPLFLDGAIGGRDALIVATEQNVVYALDAASGAVLWKTPVLAPCGVPKRRTSRRPSRR